MKPAPPISIAPLDPGLLEDRDLRLELVTFKPHAVHLVPAYHFRMMDEGSGEEAGTINLRLGWDENLTQYAGHVGYGVHEAFQGRRYAARSVTLLKPLARQHGFTEIWITCNPDNAASRRSCELAGAELIETVDLPATSQYYARGMRQKCRYRLAITGCPTSRA
jgi:predicted acetyltransferase